MPIYPVINQNNKICISHSNDIRIIRRMKRKRTIKSKTISIFNSKLLLASKRENILKKMAVMSISSFILISIFCCLIATQNSQLHLVTASSTPEFSLIGQSYSNDHSQQLMLSSSSNNNLQSASRHQNSFDPSNFKNVHEAILAHPNLREVSFLFHVNKRIHFLLSKRCLFFS